jgi:hypothetical protein
VRNSIRAEQEGYDAFVTISAPDVGSDKIREVVDLPTVFMLENAIHFALMFAPRFSFLTINAPLLLRLEYAVWPDLFGNPDSYREPVTRKAKEIVDRGADILIASPLPLSLWLIRNGLMEIDGARVLDHFACAVKMAELMVDLKRIGITRKKFTPPSRDLLEAIRNLYKKGA